MDFFGFTPSWPPQNSGKTVANIQGRDFSVWTLLRRAAEF